MTNQYNTEVTNITTKGSDVLVFTASATTTLLKTISWYSSSTASIQLKLKKYGGTTTEVASFSAAASKSTLLFSDLIALEANDEVYIQTDVEGSLAIVMVTSSESLSGQSIDVLIDVDTTGAATGDLLVYNGTSWVADSGSSSLNLTVGAVDFELATPPSLVDGRLAYDIDRESLIFQSEHGELAIGETYKPVYNNTGSTIAKGSTVKATGVSGEKFLIELFDASSGVDEELYFVGVTQAAINDQTAGIVVSEGLVKHLDTSTYTVGDILYASETAGGLTRTKPTSPNLGIPVAMVTKVDGTNGTIYVRPSIYNHLDEIHDVSISSVANNELLAYNSTSGVWQNVSDIVIDGAIVGANGIASFGNISTTGSLTAATLNVPGAVSFGQITTSTGVLTPSITFTNSGQSIIGVGGLGPDDLVIQSNGNVTVELDSDNDETSQKFAVNDPSATERFSVSDTGVVTINSAFSLPTSDGTSGQTLQTNGTGTVTWVTPSSGGASDLINDTTPQLGGDLDVNGKYLDLTQNTAGTLLVTGDQYAFRFRSGTSGAPSNTGLYFSVTNGAYEFLNVNSVPIFQIKAGTGETKIANAFTLPITDGSANQVLQTDGSGNVDWATLDTDDIPEGTSNLYWTEYRFDVAFTSAIAGTTSDDIADGTSTVIMTTAERTKLSGIAAGAEVNVNADWNAVIGDAQILNKPTLATVATTGAYADLSGLPTIPDELIQLSGSADDIAEGQGNLFLTSAERTAIANIPNEFFTVSSNANTAITLASGDEGKYIRTTAATAVTVTIPSSVFSTGDEILIEQAGAGQVTVAAGTGVTLNNSASNTAKTAEQYAVVGLKCVASNVFTLTGERELV